MKAVVIGATGFVGSAIVHELLNRDITVTAISRKEKTSEHRNLTYVALDVNQVEELAKVLESHDVVISAFSPAADSATLLEDFLEGSKAVREAVMKSGLQRFIIVGGGGSLLTEDGRNIVDTLPQDLHFIPKAKATKAYFDIIKEEKELDWAYFSPALQMNPSIKIGRTGKYRLGTDYPVLDKDGNNILSVEDVAVVITDEVLKPKHHRVRFTAGY